MTTFIVNKEHPTWLQVWEGRETFDSAEAAIEAGHPAWIGDSLADVQCERIHILFNEVTSDLRYLVLESADGDVFVVPHEMGFEQFTTLEEAVEFAFSENYLQDFDDWQWNGDETAVLVDGEILFEDAAQTAQGAADE